MATEREIDDALGLLAAHLREVKENTANSPRDRALSGTNSDADSLARDWAHDLLEAADASDKGAGCCRLCGGD